MANYTALTQSDAPAHVPQPTFRSGAVARMVGMPVATLRIWEQRYQAVRPGTAPSGHRLYSTTDVERVTILRRLTLQGHAIGLLASLHINQIRELLRRQPAVDTPANTDAAPQPPPISIVVVGQAMERRLKRLFARWPLARVTQGMRFFSSLADAIRGAQDATNASIDLLLWQEASLQAGRLPELRAAQDAWSARAVAVAYRYSNAAARAELVSAGAVVALEPDGDESLNQWLLSLVPVSAQTRSDQSRVADRFSLEMWLYDPAGAAERAPLPSRFAEGALTEFAGLSSGIACECPSHLAQLLLQISSFETYSGGCANRSAADAQLHAYLQRVAGAARMLFETALERVAIAEGLPLPSNPGYCTVV